ncbi:MAG: CRISPR-associated protein Cas4 [Leptospiraceae bacterium]|nr:CRISPR-associated protein Cas4 [Leptospiraceae bacterium]MDW8305813.1 CRISPR-associated protein Cas4 [Leptospiraceae bacterium]
MMECENYVPISAISHYLYCPRQAALIYNESSFEDNILTVSGSLGHEHVDRPHREIDQGVIREYSLPVYSDKWQIVGIADVVEFPPDGPPLPVDYKHGRIASWKNQEAQVAAIALCLEEMLNVKITTGAIYHIRSKRRRNFQIDERLRELTIKTIEELHNMFKENYLPVGTPSRKCVLCSLQGLCMPKLAVAKIPDVFTPLG